MYDNLDPYSQESIYPAKYDTIVGYIGYERVEIELLKAGRIPSNRIYMGKAQKTVVEYDNKKVVIDSVVSWVNITGLTVSKLYRFKIYTEDEYNNKSVPQEIALIPYTQSELSTIAVQSPRVLASPTTAVLDWTSNMSSILLDYYDLSYSYTDNTGVKREGERKENPRIFAGNLNPGQQITIDVNYRVVPKVNGEPILDTVELHQPVVFNMPTASSLFQPAEPEVLIANGITTFSAEGVSTIRKLVFPVHTSSLQDLFYFSNLEEIDLTGGDIFEMKTISYNRNSVVATLGGGEFLPYVRRVGDMPDVNARFLIDLLENDLVRKVKYIPHSLGIDHLLTEYIQSGKVELVQTPQEALIPFKFLINGTVQAANWKIELEENPGSYPTGTDLINIIRAVPGDRSSAFAFILPPEYEFNAEEYKYLRFKVYAPDKASFNGTFAANFQRLWPRFMNYLWAFSTESSYGQQLWNTVANDYRIPDANLQQWYDMEVNLANMIGKHNRVIVINIGGEPSGTFTVPKPIVYYFANFRLTKQ
ncbi:hypothetical protein H8B21_09725 [Sphingobacterium chuzhouense]|uniref:Uncharacterized protein n=2 Tax=Sphingobacterium chuzhouense TaxID=1742264 RepID=A0ABR7XRP1_9SPHI|nr:hypothetical protein [Sphingobacterium chuzhouense]